MKRFGTGAGAVLLLLLAVGGAGRYVALAPGADAGVDASIDASVGGAGASGEAGAGGATFWSATFPESTGSTYYISDCQAGAAAECVAGSDSNAGTSLSAPWATFAKAVQSASSSTAPGNQYLFARGASFSCGASTRLTNIHSRKENPILFGTYAPSWGSESSPRPIITATADNVRVFDLENGGNAVHDEGYVFRDLDLRGGGIGHAGFVLYNDVDYVFIDGLSISGFAIGVSSGKGNAPEEGSDNNNEYLTVRNCSITENSEQGLLDMGSHHVIEHNTFDDNGFGAAMFNHNIYLTAHVNTVGTVIRDNTLTHSAMYGGTCSGVSIVVHGNTEDLLIEDNLVQEDLGYAGGGCWGIVVDRGGYGVSEGFPRTVIRGNRVVNVGNIGIGVASCPQCVIENNVLIQEQTQSEYVAIQIPAAVRLETDVADDESTVRNNSIYIAGSRGWIGIKTAGEGAGHVVVSNAIYYTGAAEKAWDCFDTTGLTAAAFAAFDNNLCYFPNASAGRWEVTAGSLASWRSATGLDANSYQSDPLYTSMTSPFNLAISSGSSPAVGHGHATLSTSTDILGVSRGATPTIGAYQYVP